MMSWRDVKFDDFYRKHGQLEINVMNLLVTWSLPLMFLVIWLQAPRPCLAMKFYSVILTAGSSGTRVNVYKYSMNDMPVPASDVEQVKVPKPYKFQHTLSSFADNPIGLEHYVKQLVHAAEKAVPNMVRGWTTINLFATQSSLVSLNEHQKKEILKKVDEVLSNKNSSPFVKGEIKAITGQDLAVYDWIAVNFLKGVFSGNMYGKRYGALDLGGSSHQISFSPYTGVKPTTVLYLGEAEYPIYARSYPGYGGKDVRQTYFKYLVSKQFNPDATIVSSPCDNPGLEISAVINNKKYKFRGSYHEAKCRIHIKNAVFFCRGNEAECPFVNQPQLKGDFYSFDLFSYAFKATGVVVKDDEEVNLMKIKETAKSFCTLTGDELNHADPYFFERCWQLNYIMELLKRGYKVGDGKSFRLHNAEKLAGLDLKWALGAFLKTMELLASY